MRGPATLLERWLNGKASACNVVVGKPWWFESISLHHSSFENSENLEVSLKDPTLIFIDTAIKILGVWAVACTLMLGLSIAELVIGLTQ